MDIESDFCRECPEYGEPNGCNRSIGSCDAYNSCLELQTENAKLRKVADAARGIFLGEGEHLCSEFEDAMDTLRQALAELDEEGER